METADSILQFIAELRHEDFFDDKLRQSAVLQKLIVIGEAAARLPKEFQTHHPEIEWPDIVEFRNIAMHEYFAVDWNIVWVTATHDVPILQQQVTTILSEEFADE